MKQLYPCPACDRLLSPEASACPQCGHPLGSGWVEQHVDAIVGKELEQALERDAASIPRPTARAHASQLTRQTRQGGRKSIPLDPRLSFIGFIVFLGVLGWFGGEHNTDAQSKANPSTARNNPCLSAATAVAHATGAQVIGAAFTGKAIQLSHPAADEMYLFCPDGIGTPVLADGSVGGVSFFTAGDPPPASYFDLVASAGAVLSGLSEDEIRNMARTCLAAATTSKSGTVYRNLGKFGFMCDGGAATGRPYDVSLQDAFPASALADSE